MMIKTAFILLLLLTFGCSSDLPEEKVFSRTELLGGKGEPVAGLKTDSLQFATRPKNVLLTANAGHRLTPIYKVTYHPRLKEHYTGYNLYHANYSVMGESQGNQWNGNFMPGFQAMYGYNLVNVFHYNHQTKVGNRFFDQPVLIKTLYYPAFSKDTLNYEPVLRQYYMVSAYDDDTNKDGFINTKDLRRFFYFDINAGSKKPLIPTNYSVLNSEYDPANDFMYIFAKLDDNRNGQMENEEEIHIFWIDLRNPFKNGKVY